MHFDERRTHFLQDRLLRRLKECRVDSFYAYYRMLISPQGKDELAKLLETDRQAAEPAEAGPERPRAPVAAGKKPQQQVALEGRRQETVLWVVQPWCSSSIRFACAATG